MLVDAETLGPEMQTSWRVKHELAPSMCAYVARMHSDNGLLREIEANGGVRGHAELDARLCAFAEVCLLQRGILVGNSIHFDRAFLEAYCPAFCSYLSHRMVDVSCLHTLRDTWTRRSARVAKSDVAHRALADCLSSIEQLKSHKEAILGGTW